MAEAVRVGASFLDRLAADHRDALLGLGNVRRYPAQSIIFFEGDAAHDVIVVRTGSLKISATVEGREVMLDVLGPGDILGEVAAVDGLARSATLIAAWAGLSREAVVKALHALRTIGWVSTTPRSITVVDIDAVTTRAALTAP